MPRSPYARVRNLMAAVVVAAGIGLVPGTASAAGMLVPRDGSAPIQVESQRVDARVEDGVARTTVRQTFVNPHGRVLEAIYLFPVPEGAALVDVAMEVDGQRLEGLLVERRKARRIYDSIVREKRDPALVEQVGRSSFRLSVFPVVPGKPTVVELTWVEHLPLAGGAYRYVYPLALAGGTTETLKDFTLSVRMRSVLPLENVTASAPEMDVRRRTPFDWVASMEVVRARLDRDVVVTAALAAAPEPALAFRSFRGARGDGFFSLVVTPPTASADEILPRDVVLVLDTSGSMKGPKLAQAQAVARHLVEGAGPRDRVNVVRFANDVERCFLDLVQVNDESRSRLLQFVAGLEARGGTALGDAVASVRSVEAAPGRVRMVVLLTDGLPTVGQTDPEAIVTSAKATADAAGLRFHCFGVGEDVNDVLLRGIASAGRGTAELFRPEGEVETRVRRFLDRTAAPVLSDVRVEVDGVVVRDLVPRPLPDLFLGEQLAVTGRYRDGGTATITVRARRGDEELVLSHRGTFRADPGGSPSVRDLHGRQVLDFLQHALRLRLGLSDAAFFAALENQGAPPGEQEIVDALVEASLETGVQSPHTSFLVLLPEDRARLDPRDIEGLEAARERARERSRELGGETAADEPAVRDARTADHAEADSDLGDARFNSDAPFEGPGTNGVIGGGAGGALGGRRGGHRILHAGRAETKAESFVDLWFEWLRRHQSENGSWDADGFPDRCAGPDRCTDPGAADADVGVTGMALLCFLGAGETHQSGQHKDLVKEGLKYLKNVQDSEGCFGPRTGDRWRLNHAIAALAMAEAYSLTGSRLFKDSAQRGIDFLLASRDPQAAWRWGAGTGRLVDDVELTVWSAQALYSARLAELQLPLEALTGLADTEKWAPGVLSNLTGPVTTSEAAAALVRCLALQASGQTGVPDDVLVRTAERLAANPPDARPGDIALVQWGTQLCFFVGGEPWRAWNEGLQNLLQTQHVEEGSDLRGSWDPVGVRSWLDGGRIEASCRADHCRQVYYRHVRVFGIR